MHMKNLEKEIDYIIQVKEGYKFELGVFLKEIIEGSLDAEYYTKSVIDYRVLMRSINLINYDFEDWEGFDPQDINFIRDMTKYLFQLNSIESKTSQKHKRHAKSLDASQILASKQKSKQYSHFEIIKKLPIPKVPDLLE